MDRRDSKAADVRLGYYVMSCPLQQDHLVASSLKNELQSPSFAIFPRVSEGFHFFVAKRSLSPTLLL